MINNKNAPKYVFLKPNNPFPGFTAAFKGGSRTATLNNISKHLSGALKDNNQAKNYWNHARKFLIQHSDVPLKYKRVIPGQSMTFVYPYTNTTEERAFIELSTRLNDMRNKEANRKLYPNTVHMKRVFNLLSEINDKHPNKQQLSKEVTNFMKKSLTREKAHIIQKLNKAVKQQDIKRAMLRYVMYENKNENIKNAISRARERAAKNASAKPKPAAKNAPAKSQKSKRKQKMEFSWS